METGLFAVEHNGTCYGPFLSSDWAFGFAAGLTATTPDISANVCKVRYEKADDQYVLAQSIGTITHDAFAKTFVTR